MLRPLRSSLTTFEPRRLPAGDPLAQIIAAWPEIVGDDVARACKPRELRGGTLIVVTPSSSWSNQLSFLSADILTRLAQLPAGKAVTQLRFRIGRTAASGPVKSAIARTVARRVRAAEVFEPAQTLEEAFERLKRHMTERRRVLQERNANLCSRCATEIERGSLCAPCDGAQRRERIERAQRVMYDSPWLGLAKTRESVPGLDENEYTAARRELLERWWTQLSRAGRLGRLSADRHEAKIAGAYVLLQSGLAPDRVTTAVVRNLLGDALHQLVYGPDTGDS